MLKTVHHLNVEGPRKRRRVQHRPEQALQISVTQVLRVALPKTAFFFHPSNGGARTAAEAVIFKCMGVTAGVPDFIIGWNGRGFAIELKTDKTDLTPIQRDMHARMRDAGWRVEVARSLEEAVRWLDEFGIPLRLAEDEALMIKARRVA